MRLILKLSIVAATTLGGCNTSPPLHPGNVGKSSATARAAVKASPAAAANLQDMPVPPKNAQYTIYCQQFAGPDHLERSQYFRRALHDGTSMKDWYVVHEDNQSTLYYGFYPSFDRRDPKHAKQAERALQDLDAVRSMVDANGNRQFSTSLPVPINSPDPSENPNWDLSRSRGYWSLQVGAYKDSVDRKQAAVDSVSDMRAHGIEAFYFHGPSISCVCIGSWPQEAVRVSDSGDQNNDPSQSLILTQQALDEQTRQTLDQKLGMKNVAPVVQPVDPTLIAAMQQYPQHAVNGQVLGHRVTDPATGQQIIEPDRSFLVKIEHRDSDDPSLALTTSPPPVVTPSEEQPGMGHLRSLSN